MSSWLSGGGELEGLEDHVITGREVGGPCDAIVRHLTKRLPVYSFVYTPSVHKAV